MRLRCLRAKLAPIDAPAPPRLALQVTPPYLGNEALRVQRVAPPRRPHGTPRAIAEKGQAGLMRELRLRSATPDEAVAPCLDRVAHLRLMPLGHIPPEDKARMRDPRKGTS
jgi:hypothetical protein